MKLSIYSKFKDLFKECAPLYSNLIIFIFIVIFILTMQQESDCGIRSFVGSAKSNAFTGILRRRYATSDHVKRDHCVSLDT